MALFACTCFSMLLAGFAIVKKPKQSIRYVRGDHLANIMTIENLKIMDELFAAQDQELQKLTRIKKQLEEKKENESLDARGKRRLAIIEKKLSKLTETTIREKNKKYFELNSASYIKMRKALEEERVKKKYAYILVQDMRASLVVADPSLDISSVILEKMGISQQQ